MGIDSRQAALLQSLLIERSRRESSNSLSSFLRAAWPLIEPKHTFVSGWHIDAIAEHLEAVFNGQLRNLLINIPPRHSKSTIVSVGFPSWVWTKRAEHKFIYSSHSDSLSKRDSIKCRQVIQSAWYKDTFKIKWSLAEDQNEKRRFDNTEGGSRIATSVESSIIGQGGDTLVLDDPHSPRSVRSETQRQSELDWIDQEFFTRINDPKTVSKIIIMQRLDQRDASAHVLETNDWEHLMLPAEFEPERKCFTSIGWEDPRNVAGEPLWKERFDFPELNNLKAVMGSKSWAGQGQQRPAPAEGNIVKRHWWKYYTVLPEFDLVAISCDLTFKDGEKNDYVTMGVWGRKGANKYLIDQVRDKLNFNGQLSTFKNLCSKYPNASAKWVEDAANGAALITTVKSKIPGVIAIRPKGSKEARAEASAPEIEAGNVWLPDPSIAPWVNDYVEEWAVFPNGLHDDQVDQTTQALLKFRDSIVTDWMPISMTQKSKWLGR